MTANALAAGPHHLALGKRGHGAFEFVRDCKAVVQNILQGAVAAGRVERVVAGIEGGPGAAFDETLEDEGLDVGFGAGDAHEQDLGDLGRGVVGDDVHGRVHGAVPGLAHRQLVQARVHVLEHEAAGVVADVAEFGAGDDDLGALDRAEAAIDDEADDDALALGGWGNGAPVGAIIGFRAAAGAAGQDGGHQE
jgi:hypothetical protein